MEPTHDLTKELDRLTTAQLERAYWGRWLVVERLLQWVAGWLPGWNRWAKRDFARREHPHAYRLALQSALADVLNQYGSPQAR